MKDLGIALDNLGASPYSKSKSDSAHLYLHILFSLHILACDISLCSGVPVLEVWPSGDGRLGSEDLDTDLRVILQTKHFKYLLVVKVAPDRLANAHAKDMQN